MTALSGAQPAQRSAGPKRAAWRALFRFSPSPTEERGYCVTPYYTVCTVLRVPLVYSN